MMLTAEHFRKEGRLSPKSWQICDERTVSTFSNPAACFSLQEIELVTVPAGIVMPCCMGFFQGCIDSSTSTSLWTDAMQVKDTRTVNSSCCGLVLRRVFINVMAVAERRWRQFFNYPVS
jgi:hypothetical protein